MAKSRTDVTITDRDIEPFLLYCAANKLIIKIKHTWNYYDHRYPIKEYTAVLKYPFFKIEMTSAESEQKAIFYLQQILEEKLNYII